MPRPIYLFDDGLAPLAPLTDLRPVFDFRTGALTLLDRLVRGGEFDPIGLFVPDALAPLTREMHRMPVNIVPERQGAMLAINARWVLPRAAAMASLSEVGSALVDEATGEILAANLKTDHLPSLLRGDTSPFRLFKSEPLPRGGLLQRPWHVRSIRDTAIAFDLALLTTGQPGTVMAAVPSISSTAKVHPSAILDSEGGPIYVAEQAVVRPGAILIGPCAVGAHSTVLERATIRPNTVIGPHCKVAGEVSGVIFQGYANKAHDGFLGDSWVGEWVNLGAGTTNSNLLNTYGEVITVGSPGGSYERTGEQFLGAIIGDHVKTAICTRIMTGAVIHTGAMLAQTAAVNGCIGPFDWRTDEGIKQYRLSKFIDVVKAAMARRSIAPSNAYLGRISQLHAAAAAPTID